MFGKRKITVSVDKVAKTTPTETIVDDKKFERRTEVILRHLEGLGAKMFLGVCVYIILDTHRQVSIERAKIEPSK